MGLVDQLNVQRTLPIFLFSVFITGCGKSSTSGNPTSGAASGALNSKLAAQLAAVDTSWKSWGWATGTLPDQTTVTTDVRSNIFYVGEPVVLRLSNNASTAIGNAYSIRDYYGNVVDSGTVAGNSITAKVSKPGWYKLYLNRSGSVSVNGALDNSTQSAGGTTFSIIRNVAGFPARPSPSLPTGTVVAMDEPLRGLLGLGPERMAVYPDSGYGNELTRVESDVDLSIAQNTSYDPYRQRALLFAFPAGTGDLGQFQNFVHSLAAYVAAKNPSIGLVFEPRNEPNFTYDGATFARGEMKDFFTAVKAAQAQVRSDFPQLGNNYILKVIGPGAVDLSDSMMGWLNAFFSAGGGKYIDAFSFHAYNTVDADVVFGKKSLDRLQAMLANYGLGNVEKWQTEQGYMAAAYGAYMPRLQGRSTMTQMMLFEQYGIPKEHNHLWYTRSMGFWDEPMFYENSDSSLNPGAVLLGVWSEELYGTRFSEAYDFGSVGNKLFLGSLFVGPTKKVFAVMSTGATDAKLGINVTGGSSVTLISPLGVSQTIALNSGKATIPVSELPSYIELSVSQSLDVQRPNWGVNLAGLPGVKAQVSANQADASALLNGQFPAPAGLFNSEKPWEMAPSNAPGGSGSDGIEVRFPSAQSVSHVLVYAPAPNYWDGTLIHYDLQVLDASGNWATVDTVNEPVNDVVDYNSVTMTKVDSYFSDRFVFEHDLPNPVTTGGVRLLIYNYSFGAKADALINYSGGANPSGYNPITLRQIEVYGTGNSQSYQISGTVSDVNGNPLPGIEVDLTGGITQNLLSDSNGNYLFGLLPAGASYQVNAPNAAYAFQTSQSSSSSNLPTISTLSPAFSLNAGGGKLTISGTNFRSGISASVGSSVCKNPVYVNSTTMTCTIPASSSGGATMVTITNSDKTSASLNAGFTYLGAPSLWLHADDIDGNLTYNSSWSNGKPVASWKDASGHGANATQNTAAQQPTLQVGALNGLPVVRFDASGENMATGLSLSSNPFGIVLVYNFRGSDSGAHRAIVAGGANWLVGPYSGHYQIYSGGFLPNPPALTQNQFVVQSIIRSTSGISNFVNGVLAGSSSDTTLPGQLYLSEWNEPLNGDIAEILAFNTDTSSSRQSLECYLAAKYALSVSGCITPTVSNLSANQVVNFYATLQPSSGNPAAPVPVTAPAPAPSPAVPVPVTPVTSPSPAPAAPAPSPTPTAPTPDPVSTPISSGLNSAQFRRADNLTGGSWKGSYGSDGYLLHGDATKPPSYAQVSLSGNNDATWATPGQSSDPRALQSVIYPSSSLASCWFSPGGNGGTFTINVNMTDSAPHTISLYMLDWDSSTRQAQIDVFDAASGAKLDSQALNSYHQGSYLSWSISGAVQFKITSLAGYNAVVSGIFFGNLPAPPPSGTASFDSADSGTGGAWKGNYGADGYDLHGDGMALPSYAKISVSGSNDATWALAGQTQDLRALQSMIVPNAKLASAWYSPGDSAGSFTVNATVTDGAKHEVSLYFLDWDSWKGLRQTRVDVFDAASGAKLDSQTLSSYNQGTYLSWTISGGVQFKITSLAGGNAVLSGIFFGNLPSPPPPGTAGFIGADKTTGGSWKGSYGLDGYLLHGDASKLPSYAQVSLSGNNDATWATPGQSSDPRALQSVIYPSSSLASCWFSPGGNGGTFTINVNMTDSALHTISLYMLDWDSSTRQAQIDVFDAASGAKLDSQTLSSYNQGTYLSWNISGAVQFKITSLAGYNAVVSAILFGRH